MSKISEHLQALRVEISTLEPLTGNPRQGNIPALRKSLERFGQLKPIVYQVRKMKGGKSAKIVIAGNHTLAAARDLGWDEIAAVDASHLSEEEANAFALADNRIADLGIFDDRELAEFLKAHKFADDSLIEAAAFSQQEITRLMSSISENQFAGFLDDLKGDKADSWGIEMNTPEQASHGLVAFQVMMLPEDRKSLMAKLKNLVETGVYPSTGEALLGLVLDD